VPLRRSQQKARMNSLILLGSARSNGNTAHAARHLATGLGDGCGLIDLLERRIDRYAYDAPPGRDDFLAIAERMLAHHHLIFATPVYWYAMSGIMKTLFDRLTDLIYGAREQARALAGRRMWVLATGTDRDLPAGFQEPFARTAGYLGMRWCGSAYVCVAKGVAVEAQDLGAATRLAAAIRTER